MYDVATSGHRPPLNFLIDHLNDRGAEISSINEFLREIDPERPGVSEWVDEVPLLQQSHQFNCAIVEPQAIVLGGVLPRIWQKCSSCEPRTTTAGATGFPDGWPVCSSRKSQAMHLQSGRPRYR